MIDTNHQLQTLKRLAIVRFDTEGRMDGSLMMYEKMELEKKGQLLKKEDTLFQKVRAALIPGDDWIAALKDCPEFLIVALDAKQEDMFLRAELVQKQVNGDPISIPVKKGHYVPFSREDLRPVNSMDSMDSVSGESPLRYAQLSALMEILTNSHVGCDTIQTMASTTGENMVALRYMGEDRTDVKIDPEQTQNLITGTVFILDKKLLAQRSIYAIMLVFPASDTNFENPISWMDDTAADDGKTRKKQKTVQDNKKVSKIKSSAKKTRSGVQLDGFLRYHLNQDGTGIILERMVLNGDSAMLYDEPESQDGIEANKKFLYLLPAAKQQHLLEMLRNNSTLPFIDSLDCTYPHPIVYWNNGREDLKVDGEKIDQGTYQIKICISALNFNIKKSGKASQARTTRMLRALGLAASLDALIMSGSEDIL